MIALLKKVWAKLEVPEDDWLLSRYGGCEPLDGAAAANGLDSELPGANDASTPPVSARQPFSNWFGEEVVDESAPPQSVEMSSNAAYDIAPQGDAEHRSRAG